MISVALLYLFISSTIFFGVMMAIYLTNPGPDDDDIDND